eukprot:557176-Pelagomonas_calceolata.AAC.6
MVEGPTHLQPQYQTTLLDVDVGCAILTHRAQLHKVAVRAEVLREQRQSRERTGLEALTWNNLKAPWCAVSQSGSYRDSSASVLQEHASETETT